MRSVASVAMLTSVHPVFDVRIFEKECRSLVTSGYDVTLIAPHDRDEVVEGVTILGFPRVRGRLRRMTITAWSIYQKAKGLDADVYHFHDPELIPVGLLLRLTGRTVIYDVHEYYPAQVLSRRGLWGFQYIVAATVRCIEILAFPVFSGVIAVDSRIAERCSAKAVVVGNYPAAVKPRQTSRQRDGVLKLVYAGSNLVAVRGLFKMIEALEYLDGMTRLVLIGRYSEADRRHAQRLSGYSSVEWWGVLSHGDTLDAMSSMDLGLLLLQPTPGYVDVSDGCLKLFEYMSCGLPVVASDFPGLSRVVVGERCGTVADPTDARSIARAINSLANAPGMIESLGANGRAAVSRKYNWNSSAQQMLALYRKLLAAD